MSSLHSNKIKDETNAFIDELYTSLPSPDDLKNCTNSSRIKTIHKTLLPIYIMKYYCEIEFESPYFDSIISSLLESEIALILGIRNSGISCLRSALESAFKLLYYEVHPVECFLHLEDKHSLTAKDYRDFIYTYPGLSSIQFMGKDVLESLWSELCKYIHNDFKVIVPMNFVANITPITTMPEIDYQKILILLKQTVKVILAVFFSVNSKWAARIEKAYYDFILETYDPEQRMMVIRELKVS